MIDNSVFALTDDELVKYNLWANNLATDMVNAEIGCWTVDVKFSFSSFGTRIVARCSSACDHKNDLVIRDDMDDW